MKSSKKWFLTAVLIVTALLAANQRSFADWFPDMYNGTGLNGAFSSLGGTPTKINNPTGTFDATDTRVYLLSADPTLSGGLLSLSINGSTASPFTIPTYNNTSGFSGAQLIASVQSPGGVISFTMTASGVNWSGVHYSDLENNSNSYTGNMYNTNQPVSMNHFAYFDVTSLLGNVGTPYTAAYLVGYEDIANGVTPFDYNDAVFLVLENRTTSGGGGGVPEPATLLLWSLGSLGLAGKSWYRKRAKKNLLMA